MPYFIISSESSPTQLRNSVIGIMQLVGLLGIALSKLFNNFNITHFGSLNLGFVLAVFYLPIMMIALFILFYKIRETKSADLNEIE